MEKKDVKEYTEANMKRKGKLSTYEDGVESTKILTTELKMPEMQEQKLKLKDQ